MIVFWLSQAKLLYAQETTELGTTGTFTFSFGTAEVVLKPRSSILACALEIVPTDF